MNKEHRDTWKFSPGCLVFVVPEDVIQAVREDS